MSNNIQQKSVTGQQLPCPHLLLKRLHRLLLAPVEEERLLQIGHVLVRLELGDACGTTQERECE